MAHAPTFPRSHIPTFPRAFSLAEMMIALAILGMGLLVIGAALPVGLRYTRESVNIATGQAAAEHALDLIAQNVCLPPVILDITTEPPRLVREPVLFQPRQSDPPDPTYPQSPGEFIPNYEPVIKVRPLYTQNVNATPGSTYYGYQDDGVWVFNWNGVLVEDAILTWLTWLTGLGMDQPEECANTSSGRWLRWALPSTALVYPPVTPNGTPNGSTQYLPGEFLADQYVRWPAANETRKVLDSLISWTAFYRRVSYDDPATLTINEDDPTLYEFIAVAVRRPSLRHRFPVQQPADGGMSYISLPSGTDTAVPVPWLASFAPPPSGASALAVPPGIDPITGGPFDANGFPAMAGQSPATMTFYCTQGPGGLSGLFPVGSIFIPARNDVAPSIPPPNHILPANRVGFGPPAPTTLPIYEVVQRPDDFTVIVKFNGYYPMQGTPGLSPLGPPAPVEWPVWVIPPAYEELSGGNPVFPNRSPIVAVARRYVRLREIP